MAEYFRDQGLHVALMADSTSRWAEALREVSGRFGELPGEGGYPAYLSSRLADFYERAALVETLAASTGSVTVMGAISPPSGDFSEPVTSHTKRYVAAFWALDVKRAQARFYPAIHPLQSYAEDAREFAPWWAAQGNGQWLELRRRFLTLLDEQAQLERMARIIGKDALPARQQLTLFCAELVNEAFLRQSAFSEIDRVCSPQRQARDDAAARPLHRPGRGGARRPAPTPDRIGAHRLHARAAAHGRGDRRGRAAALRRAGGAHGARVRRSCTAAPDAAHDHCEPAMLLTVEGAATRLEGPLLFLRRTLDVGLNDAVEVRGGDGRTRLGRIAAIDEQFMTIEVLESTAGLSLDDTRGALSAANRCTSASGPASSGRVFNGVGQVIDGGPPVAGAPQVPIDGLPLNPVARALPRDFIETGISTVDLMNSLVRGQKLPIFSGGGLPHDRLAVEIANHARLRGTEAQRLRHRLRRHRRALRQRRVLPPQPRGERRAGAHGAVPQPRQRLEHAAPADAALRAHRRRVPGLRRRQACAGHPDRHDQLLRGAARGVVEQGRDPEPQGLPGLHVLGPGHAVRARRLPAWLPGTLTQLSILTMPSDDIGHPIPDLTGYITEGQIVLSRDLDRARHLSADQRAAEPVAADEGRHRRASTPTPTTRRWRASSTPPTPEPRRRGCWPAWSAKRAWRRSTGKYLRFGTAFEQTLVSQSEARTLEQSMAIGWRLLRRLPRAS